MAKPKMHTLEIHFNDNASTRTVTRIPGAEANTWSWGATSIGVWVKNGDTNQFTTYPWHRIHLVVETGGTGF